MVLLAETTTIQLSRGKATGNARCFPQWIVLSGSLILEEVAPVGFDEKCPSIEPEVGWNRRETTAEKTLAREMES